MNRVFLPQANIHFVVQDAGSFSYPYDTDGDKKLHFDRHPTTGQGCYDCLTPGVPPNEDTHAEMYPLYHKYFFKKEGESEVELEPMKWLSGGDRMYVWFVHDISEPLIEGFAETGNPFKPGVVKTRNFRAAEISYTAAHEIGHILSAPHHLKLPNEPYLMKVAHDHSSPNPDRLIRIDWNALNRQQ